MTPTPWHQLRCLTLVLLPFAPQPLALHPPTPPAQLARLTLTAARPKPFSLLLCRPLLRLQPRPPHRLGGALDVDQVLQRHVAQRKQEAPQRPHAEGLAAVAAVGAAAATVAAAVLLCLLPTGLPLPILHTLHRLSSSLALLASPHRGGPLAGGRRKGPGGQLAQDRSGQVLRRRVQVVECG